jgi:hypothetical protein
MYATTQVHFVHYIIVSNPRIVPEFIIHPGHGGEPRVDKQYVHLLCDTLTHVFFVHFGSKCHNTQMQKQGRQYIIVHYTTVHFLTVHYKTVCYRAVVAKQYSITKRYRYKMVHSLKTVNVTKQYGYKMSHYKTVHIHYGGLHNSTLQSQSTGLHQPKD